MATVESPQEHIQSLSVGQESTAFLSLTMAALRLVNPWGESKPQWQPEPGSEEARDRVLTLAEVACHDTPQDCWVVIYDRVYDITTFLDEESTAFLSLTMAALRLVNLWGESKPQWQPEPGSEEARDRVLTLADVACHDTPRDCWVVIYDRVYDITTFLDEHPGGAEIMLEYAGRDASFAFRGSGHSKMAAKALDRFIVGELPMHERMYRKAGGIRLSDIPE